MKLSINKMRMICGVMFLLGFVGSSEAFMQSDPALPQDANSETIFNFYDEGRLDEKIPPPVSPTPAIEWNLTDQTSGDDCEREMGLARAGYPLQVSRRASTTYNQKYEGYFVGGGVPAGRMKNRSCGQPRYRNEGTWGMDYAPFYTRVVSNWSHGRLFQGGTGQYEPDHRNRPFGQTFGKHFGNRDRRFETDLNTVESPASPSPDGVGGQ